MNLSAFSDVETQISKIKIENEVDSLKNYISLQGQVQSFSSQSEFRSILKIRKNEIELSFSNKNELKNSDKKDELDEKLKLSTKI